MSVECASLMHVHMCFQDPQHMQQALTNVLLMDTVVGCLQSQKGIIAASKLAYYDRLKHEGMYAFHIPQQGLLERHVDLNVLCSQPPISRGMAVCACVCVCVCSEYSLIMCVFPLWSISANGCSKDNL